MSPEAVLSVGVAPTSSPGSAASAAAVLGGGCAAGGGGGSGAGDTSGAASGFSADSAERSTQPADAQANSPAQRNGRAKGSAAGTRARTGQQTKNGAPAAKNFSQALAQSLAAPAQAHPAAPHAGSGAAKPSAHAPSKAHKSDPVSAAMAMMSQTVPLAAVAPKGAAAGAKSPASSGTAVDGLAHVNPAGVAAESAAHKLAQTAGIDVHAGQGAAAQNNNTAGNLGNVQALSAGQLAASVHAAARPPALAASAVLSAPVGSNSWNEQLGTQLTWMASQGVQSASLQIAPQHLGPVHVSISVHHGEASVWFGAAQPETRQALSQALPQLRAMFASQGLALTDSGVSQDTPRDSRRPARSAVNAVGEVGAVDGSSGTVAVGLSGAGLIDTYA